MCLIFYFFIFLKGQINVVKNPEVQKFESQKEKYHPSSNYQYYNSVTSHTVTQVST